MGTERPGWKLVWADEFDRDGAPDPARWSPEVGMIRNNELQYYTDQRPENARVEHGCLILEARKEPYQGAGYTSASLTTERSASWTYGRIEVRAQIPSGRGLWPAIWMLGTNIRTAGWPACGEIDIMENVGFDHDKIFCTVHTVNPFKDNDHASQGAALDVPKPSAGFHLYAVEWDAREMVFLFDEHEVFRFAKDVKSERKWVFDAPQYLILNVAYGGEWGGQKGVDDAVLPQRMLVDYVRVYQRPKG